MKLLNQLLVTVLILAAAGCASASKKAAEANTDANETFNSQVKLVYFNTNKQIIRIVDHQYPAMPKSPLEGTSDVFLATVFGCKDCPRGLINNGMTLKNLEANGMFIGWLEKIDPSVSEEQAMFGEGYEYCEINKPTWYAANDQGYEKIMSKIYKRCPDARICLP